MTKIITFLGQGCTVRTTIAIASAKWFTQQKQRVLLVTDTLNHHAEILLETTLNPYPQVIERNLQVVQFQTTVLLEQAWEEIKQLISTYLPTTSAEVYPGELLILPGFDNILAFNALRQYYLSGDYDVIIYDGESDKQTLRMLGIPNALDWYFSRSYQIFESLDLSKIAASFGGPIASAFLAANIDTNKLQQGRAQVQDWIDQGMTVVSDPNHLTAYLVTTEHLGVIATTRWLWGSAQQINLSVSGVLAYDNQTPDEHAKLQQAFTPLVVNSISALHNQNWDPIIQALPDFNAKISLPQPLTLNLNQQQLRVFLPGFNKKQVKLTQYGSEIIIDAGDQRRRIPLPSELQGQSLKVGKFEEPYLTVDF